MHTQEEALKILGCDKSTLSRYVKKGKLERVKKGRSTYYDEHEVAALVKEIENNKKKVGIEIKPKEKIELPSDLIPIVDNIAAGENLNRVGYEYLAEATGDLKELDLYKDCDKHILILYALSVQNFFKYLHASNQTDGVTVNDMGTYAVHPHFKIMQHHEKQMNNYMDRLGLNPLSRTKFTIEEKKKPSSILDILNEE